MQSSSVKRAQAHACMKCDGTLDVSAVDGISVFEIGARIRDDSKSAIGAFGIVLPSIPTSRTMTVNRPSLLSETGN